MEISIRKATAQDAEEVSNIWATICSERIYSAVTKPFTPQQERKYISSLSDREGIFVAELKGQIIGFQSLDKWAEYSDSFDHVGVIGTFIIPEWRKKGIGTQLAKETFAFARIKKYEKIIIYIRSLNAGALTFYKNLGFIEIGILSRQVKIDNHYEDEIFLELFL